VELLLVFFQDAGDYSVTIAVDSENQISESNEENNIVHPGFPFSPRTGDPNHGFPLYAASMNDGVISGLVANVDFSQYQVALTFRFGACIFQTQRGVLADINPDGTWSQLIVTHPNDVFASKIWLMWCLELQRPRLAGQNCV